MQQSLSNLPNRMNRRRSTAKRTGYGSRSRSRANSVFETDPDNVSMTRQQSRPTEYGPGLPKSTSAMNPTTLDQPRDRVAQIIVTDEDEYCEINEILNSSLNSNS